MGWVESEANGLFGPGVTDVFVRGEAREGLEATGEVVSHDEVSEMASQLVVGLVVVALHSRFLDRPVHSFDLAVRPRMVGLCESVLDAVLPASAIERMTAPHCGGFRTILCQVSELNAVVGKHGMDLVGNGFDQRLQEVRGHAHGGFLVQLDEGELGGPVDRHEQVEPAFLSTDLGNVEVEVADRIGLDLRLSGLSPSTSGRREMPWRCRQRCSDERVRCGSVACRA